MAVPLKRGSESGEARSADNSPSSRSSPLPHIQASDKDHATDGGSCVSQPAPHKISYRNAVISIAVIDEHSFTREAITRSLQNTSKFIKISYYETSEHFIESNKCCDVILYYEHENAKNQKNIDTKYTNIKKLSSTAPVILLCEVDSSELLHAAFDCGVRGYIPTASTTIEVAIEIIYLIKAGGIFVPPSSLSSRRITLPAAHKPTISQEFTPRQMAVLERVRMGQTNKIIAFELNMSESSVKTHIQNIMRKMRVTNRTAAAYLAQELEMNGIRRVDQSLLTDDHDCQTAVHVELHK